MGKYTLKDFARQILSEVGRPMTASDIWEHGLEKGYDKIGNFVGKRPWETISKKIGLDIKDNPDSVFYMDDTVRPKLFSLKGVSHENTQVQKLDVSIRSIKFAEKELHPFLASFAYTYLDSVYTKTIRHNKSKQSKYKEWIHPDMVGVRFPVDSWKKEVIELSREMGLLPVHLYSFEIKKELTSSNLRQFFFQAVSNSSWAHEGYLAAAYLEKDDDFHQELKRLSNSFGIGVIKLDTSIPDNSEIIVPAKTKEDIDWDTLNILSSINNDVLGFIEGVRDNAKINKIQKGLYDEVYDTEHLVKLLSNSK